MKGDTIQVVIKNEMDVARAICCLKQLCQNRGLSDVIECQVATAVSELGINIVRYAKYGTMTMKSIQKGEGNGIEIVAEDRGPGISNVDEAMADHYSTGGSLGLGLPGVKRIMDEFEVNSIVGMGTRVLIRKWA